VGDGQLSELDWNEWLGEATQVLEVRTAPEERVDEVLAAGLALTEQGVEPDDVDQVRIARVMACLAVRRAALGVELADLSRRRAVLALSREGSTRYLNAPTGVPMQ
jgi:hypothetical protein